MILRSIFIVGALALLSSCGAGGAKFSGLEKPTDKLAQVYLYRPSAIMQSGNYPDITLDSKAIGQLKTGGYLTFAAPAGDHMLNLKAPNFMMWIHKERNIPLKLAAGNTYFYKLDITGQYSYRFGETKDKAEALAELKKLNESK